jgi:hypothetical protein
MKALEDNQIALDDHTVLIEALAPLDLGQDPPRLNHRLWSELVSASIGISIQWLGI